ncbi:MAG TPA: ribonuclease P protein component [Clostridiaceae bacterium]|jgi:ribonuclease P protein component|nr:ribonuclease P protein component [Clostridiaceae bacterium]
MKKTIPIKCNREFAEVYKKGKFFAGKYIVLYVLPNRLDINRLGITASKKAGKSIRRNRIKRLIKENYRMNEELVRCGYDLVFVVRNNEILPSYYDIKREMGFLFRKLNLIDKGKNNC